MKSITLRSIVMSLLLLSAAYGQDNLQAKLRNEFLNTQQTLRNFPAGNHLRYDAAGNLVSKNESGVWPVYGTMIVEQVNLEADRLRIHGHRAVMVFNPDKKRLEAKSWENHFVTVEVATTANTSQPEQLHAVLNKVFISSPEKLLNELPDYWEPYFAGEQTGTNSCGTGTDAIDIGNDSSAAATSVRGGKVEEGRQIRFAHPRPTFASKTMEVRGGLVLKAVIDTTGKVKDICILKPLGAGLDDSSVAAVRLWEYTPYKLNGKPVEIKTTINFSFR